MISRNCKIIGFYGGYMDRSGVGKTTVANMLVKDFGFNLYSINKNVESFAKKLVKWDGKKDKKGIEILNEVCKIGRNLTEDYWLNLTLSSIPDNIEKVVLDDVNFSNEYEIIKKMKGIVVLIERPNYKQPNWEFSPDDIINNNGDIKDLEKKVQELIKKHYNIKTR